jgi:hypothetical protein
MDDFDLNIDNYNFNEMLQLFGMTPQTFDRDKMKKRTEHIKQRYNAEIYMFYLKIYKLVLTAVNNTGMTISNIPKIERYINKIKGSFMDDTEFVEMAPHNHPIVDSGMNNVILNTFPNPIVAGDINVLKRITHITNLNMNSCFRNNYKISSSTDFL